MYIMGQKSLSHVWFYPKLILINIYGGEKKINETQEPGLGHLFDFSTVLYMKGQSRRIMHAFLHQMPAIISIEKADVYMTIGDSRRKINFHLF